MIYVAHPSAHVSIAVDVRQVSHVEGSCYVLKNGRRVPTAYSEADLLLLLRFAPRVEGC